MTLSMQNISADFTSLSIKHKANDAPLDVLYWNANFAKLFMNFCCFSGTTDMRISGEGYLLQNVFNP